MGNMRSTDCLLWFVVVVIFLCVLGYAVQSVWMVKILPDLMSELQRLRRY
jgi:hypothetical protein